MNLKSVLLAKVFGLSIIAIMVSGTAVSPVFASTATSGDLYFTTFAGGTNVNKVHYTYDGASTFTLGSITNIASTTTADGLNFIPNGKLFVGGQGDSAHVVDPNAVNSFYTLTAGGTSCFHTSLIGTDQWCGGIPGNLAKFVSPYTTNGVALPILGDEAGIGVDSLVAVPGGTVFYTSSTSSGGGHFGSIDLATGITTRLISGAFNGPHGMAYDSFTGDIFLCGADKIHQINPSAPSVIISTYTSGISTPFDQCTTDGKGHLFAANNGGNLLFMDYSASGLVGDASNFVTAPFLAANLDDVAPLSGTGSHTSTPVGGTIIPVDMTALFIAGAMTNAFWILPTFGGITGAALALFKIKRKHN